MIHTYGFYYDPKEMSSHVYMYDIFIWDYRNKLLSICKYRIRYFEQVRGPQSRPTVKTFDLDKYCHSVAGYILII